MATVLQNLFAKKRALKELQAEIDRLENDPSLKNELEFSDKLNALMDEYGMSLSKINAMLDPDYLSGKDEPARKRRERIEKVYVNPQTGEEVRTKGGNHKILRAWKEQYGGDVVESWLRT